jgi:hypothetical protein
VLRGREQSPHGTAADATGYRGFYYHFLDMQTGKRAWNCELSTIDFTFLLAGALTTALYFDYDSEEEQEIRSLADALYRRVDWPWAQNGGATVTMGWKPESGFLPFRWDGYDEALLLYILGLGSPTHPLPAESYKACASTYEWKEVYGYELLQFEFAGYGEYCWGLTASEGPGPATHLVNGVERVFWDYEARGALGLDDGTVAPWAVVASLPFAPEIVIPTFNISTRVI